jgi:hypothetical protein
MTLEDFKKQPTDENSFWSASDMVFRGTFGTGTLAERRFLSRTRIASAAVLCAVLLIAIAFRFHLLHQPTMGLITLFLPGPLATYIALEGRKYFLTLDELTRRVELEAMAWTYATGSIAAMWLCSIAYALTLRWPLDPKLLSWIPILVFVVVLGLIQGGYRYLLARRYR